MEYPKLFLTAAMILILNHATAAEVEKVLRNVPKEDRLDFIRYYALLGYELSSGRDVNNNKNSGKGLDLDSVSNFSIELYKRLTEKKGLKQRTARTYGSNIICFPNNQCIDVGDAGIHP